jgi:hypothetical protein
VLIGNLMEGKYTIRITDISGKVCLSETIVSAGNVKSRFSIGSKLIPGTYCVSLKGEHKGLYNSKLIIEKSHD